MALLAERVDVAQEHAHAIRQASKKYFPMVITGFLSVVCVAAIANRGLIVPRRLTRPKTDKQTWGHPTFFFVGPPPFPHAARRWQRGQSHLQFRHRANVDVNK